MEKKREKEQTESPCLLSSSSSRRRNGEPASSSSAMASAATPPIVSSPHSSMQYLSSLLSQRGPNALPYREDSKLFIRQHLLQLMQQFPSLRTKPAPFVHNDGNSLHLLQADGTIPMTFQGHTYNIPVTIWLLESYPQSAPRIFVNPTKDMIIKRSHKHVDASGMVSVPYLQNWIYPRSNLADLVRSLSAIFGQDPPLYAKPSSQQHLSSHYEQGSPSRLNPGKTTFGAGSGSSGPTAGQSSTFPSPVRPSVTQTQSQPQKRTESPKPSGRPPNARSSNTDDPSEVFRRNATTALVDRLKLDVSVLQTKRESGMDSLVTTQGQLKQRKGQLKQGVEQLQHEKEQLEQQLRLILTNTETVHNWLRQHDANEGILDIDIDDAFEPCDALSKQMLECTSQDLAIEDVIYSMDKAVQEGSIPVDAYLKQVRNLAREQFFHRAISEKIQEAQHRLQIANMAVRYAS